MDAALRELKVKPVSLTAYNFESQTSSAAEDKPWLITYCTDSGGDCLDRTACTKLAAILVCFLTDLWLSKQCLGNIQGYHAYLMSDKVISACKKLK